MANKVKSHKNNKWITKAERKSGAKKFRRTDDKKAVKAGRNE